jgi:hypothetical protein
MKILIALTMTAFLTSSAYALDLGDVSMSKIRKSKAAVPKPVAADTKSKALNDKYLCYGSNCAITTSKTNVCSDGMRIDTKKVKNKETGKEEYKDKNLKKWAEYQEKLGKNTKWKDKYHSNMTATGEVNSIETAYVVVPNSKRKLLRKTAKVCVVATGKCINAQVLEIGPAFGELSVGAMMQLGLDSHPSYGRYDGEVSYSFDQ